MLNLFYNGWHPVLPWLGFFTFGMFLSKLDLGQKTVATKLSLIGAIGLVVLPFISQILVPFAPLVETNLDLNLFATSPIPPGPIYMLTGISAAVFIIGVCLLLPTAFYENKFVAALSKTGTHTLTHYFAHILIGMGIMEEFGLIAASNPQMSLAFTLPFVGAAILFSHFWSQKFDRGPIETVMRKLCG